MEKTQQLLSIALAVLALDGCAGAPLQAGRPEATPTPRASSHSSSSHHSSIHFWHSGAVGAGAAAAAASRNRVVGAKRGNAKAGGRGGGFGKAGAHGAGG